VCAYIRERERERERKRERERDKTLLVKANCTSISTISGVCISLSPIFIFGVVFNRDGSVFELFNK
jgi:hypothetical protein